MKNKKTESKEKPTFKKITPEMLKEHLEIMTEAAAKASEAMKRGEYLS